MSKHHAVSGVVIIFYDLCEVRAAFWARQTMLISIPLIVAFVAEHHVAVAGLLVL